MNHLLDTLRCDSHRYTGSYSIGPMLKLYFRSPGFKHTVHLRLANTCRSHSCLKFLFPIVYLFYRHSMIKYGLLIPYKTTIGKGFYIGHWGGIVINSNVVIGDNVNISHGITIGQGGDDCSKGSPIIGDKVYIGPNSTIIGPIYIGEGSAIGAQAFVNADIPANVSVGGVPAKVISEKGSSNYIHNISSYGV